MDSLKILATGAGSPGAGSIIKALRKGASSESRGIEMMAADADADAYGFQLSERGMTVPKADREGFIDAILGICEREKPDLLFSWVEPELLPLSRSAAKLDELGVALPLSEPKAIEMAGNKSMLYSMAPEHSPRNITIKTLEEFKSAAGRLGYPDRPVCFKPSVSYGQRGFRVIRPGLESGEMLFREKPTSVNTTFQDACDMLKSYERKRPLPELIVMEFLEGREYSVDMLLRDGEPIVTIPRERVRTRQGISTITRLEDNQSIMDASEEIAKKIGLSYNVNMQFMLTDEGPKLIEINPRLSGTVAACVGGGANLPWLAAKMALGERIVKPVVRWGTTAKMYRDAVFSKNGETWEL